VLPFLGLSFPVMLWCGQHANATFDQKCLCAIHASLNP
jgi:hypothetical protein